MSDRIFRIFNPGGSKEDRAEKRRGQLRRAQKSYRDRKDLYTKSLESELAKTRARESNLVRECEQLQNTVKVLLERLSQYGIDTPPELGHDGENVFVPKTAQQLASPVSLSALGSTEDGREPAIRHRAHPSQRELPHLPRSPRALLSGGSSNDQLCNLDPVMVGMEFVLTLERPCLDHIHGDPANPYKPTGHALTASAQLLFISPPLSPALQESCTPSYDNCPTAVLDRLLNLSPEVCSEGELTPTQAWNYIRSQPHFGGIDVQSLRTLTGELCKKIACHGYGAAVEVGALESLVFDTLIRSRPL